MMEKNLFLVAAKNKFRFNSTRGLLTVEQLWELPLTAANGFCLDNVAKFIHSQIKANEAESFVENTNSAALTRLTDELEVVKAVIADKQADYKLAAEKTEKRARRQKLLAALESREATDLAGKSREELLKELADID